MTTRSSTYATLFLGPDPVFWARSGEEGDIVLYLDTAATIHGSADAFRALVAAVEGQLLDWECRR